jgi:hypothetical protein
MKADHFLHCRDCETLFRPSPYDCAPEFQMTIDGFTETPRDDCMDFLTRHARHQLQTLRLTTPYPFRTGATWDAAAATYWEVSNGEQDAVVEGRRAQLGSALHYRLRSGRVVAERVAVEIPTAELRERVDRALYPGVAPERKLAAFVEAAKAIVWEVDPAAFEILYDVPGEPTLAVARIPAVALGRLWDAVARVFDPTDSTKIIGALTGTTEDGDELTVLLRQQIRVEG